MAERAPTGVITLMFTDIQDSTALWDRMGDAFRPVLDRHNELVRELIGRWDGYEVKSQGDSFMVAFARATDAVQCAVDIQRRFAEEDWPEAVGEPLVRIGLHTGEAFLGYDSAERPDYFGPMVNRAARVADAGHGGQMLLSAATHDIVHGALTADMQLLDLGAHRLRGLDEPEHLFEVRHPELPIRHFPPLRTLDRHPHNLPAQLTSFVGRAQELARIAGMLRDPEVRLVTLTGPGGVGKTRLALAAAADCVGHFSDGVWAVALAEVRQAERVPAQIAAALGIRLETTAAPAQEVCEYLAERNALLVLDNFEQVAEAAPLVTDVLRSASRVKCLVTSRTVLRVGGEQIFDVPPMPVPDATSAPEQMAHCDSVALLTERVRTHRTDWGLTPENAAGVAALCGRLEGIPLAIELAASRLHAMSVEEVARRLTRRFQILTTRQPDLPPRQRALRSAIEWSHDLLSAGCQQLLAQLSVFSGGFFMESAEAICEGVLVLDGVLDLCDQSLLSSRETAGRTRYVMLESIREFAAEQLPAEGEDALRQRHAEYFLAFAQEREAQAAGAEEARAFAELEADLDNARAGMDWAVSRGDDRLSAEYAAAFATFLWRRGHWQEQLERVQVGLAAAERLDPPDSPLLGRLLYRQTAIAQDLGDRDGAAETCRRGLEVARESDDARREAMFLNLQALILRGQDEPDQAGGLLEESLSLARKIGYARGEGMALHNLGLLAHGSGDTETAERLYQEALPVRRQGGDERGAAETLNNLGVLAEEDGRLEEAAALYRDALEAYVRLQDPLGIAVGVCNLGEIAEKAGDLRLAAGLLAAAARALAELRSVHADHAAECSQRVRAQLPRPPSPESLPWREALVEAAERALAEPKD
ncbi:MAG: adenylate/guanylate cyclase domain-containing protein [Armatimonadota bacterium]